MGRKTEVSAAPVACPQCGNAMVANPAPDKRTIVKTMLDSNTPAAAPYAENFANRHLEKEAAHGVVHVCSACRYVTRIKAA